MTFAHNYLWMHRGESTIAHSPPNACFIVYE